MTTYIQLNDLGNLDIKQELSVPLNFSIAEIQDISKKQGGFSKTIVLAGSSNNNNLLGNLFDVNIADASFNINIKQKCQIIQNGISVFDGYLQLLNVNKITPSLGNPDEYVEYEVAVKDDTGNFYSSMQEKMLEDLPYWNQYNHIYTLTGITSTSANTSDDGYTYILPFNSNTNYKITDFAPAIYAKAYWDRIFIEAGYTYQWDSLTGCSFDKLVIPYNGDTPLFNNANKNFRAGFETGATDTLVLSASNVNTDNGTGYDESKLIFEEDSISPNFDNGNNYNDVTGTYTSPFNGTGEFKTKYKYELKINVPVDCKLQGIGQTSFLKVQLGSKIKRTSGSSTPTQESLFFDSILYSGAIGAFIDFTAGTQSLVIDITPEINSLFGFLVGDTFENYLTSYLQYQGVWFEDDGSTPLAQANIPRFEIVTRIDPTEYDNNFFLLNLTGNLNEGQIVDVQRFIPKKVKQKDFISGIVKLFNLYITPDKYEENHLIIQTRDDYYDSGSIIDWTQKFTLDNDAKLEFLPDLQDKRLILSYKQDSDEWNKQYQLATAEVYGQVQYEFESEFTQSTKIIENIFSPTPIITSANNLLVPAIVAQAPKTNIRILFYDGWKNGQWNYIQSGTSVTNTFNSYPRALHLNDPITPSIDINYAEPDYFGYSNYQTVTNNNLYNAYWSRFINQIETGRLLSATFYLNEVDIHNLDLRSKVWVHDTYWNINKIIDYNPNGNGLTKVELISVDNGLQFAPFPIDKNSTGNTVTDVGPKNNWVTNFVSLQGGTNGNIYGTTVVNSQVLGNDNIVQGGSQEVLVVGNGNNVSGRFAAVFGEDNTVEGENLFLFGGSGVTLTGSSQAVFAVPVVATTISADTLFIGGSDTPIEAPVFIAGAGIDSAQQVITIGSNNASGQSSFVAGLNSTASALAATAIGDTTQATGDSSFASGFGSQATGFQSFATGRFSLAKLDGEIVGNATQTSTAGQVQFGIVNAHVQTTNATPTTLDFLLNSSPAGGFQIPINTAMSFNYTLTCYRQSDNTARILSGEGLVKRGAGVHTLVYSSVPNNNGDAALFGVLVAPAISTGLVFTVTGLAASTIDWTLRLDYNYGNI